MKKLVSFLLACLLMASALCLLVGAEDAPAADTAFRPVGETALEVRTSIPVGYTIISNGLYTSSVFSQYSYTANSITNARDQWDLGRYLTYGFSVMGVGALERPISGSVDGIWTSGNTGDKLQNGSKAKGAFAYIPNGEKYNHLGETGKEDSIYSILLTYNFGQLAKLDSFGYATSGLNNMLQAADIYTSCDGENWTLLGYYDRTALRMSGAGDIATINGADLGADALDGVYDKVAILFDLKGTEAQFLRICGISHGGKTNPANPEDYTTYSNSSEEKTSWRETVVYGMLLDKQNTVTAVEKPFDDGTDITTGEATNEQETGNKVPDIPVKPNVTKAPETTEAAPETTPAPTGEANQGGAEEKGGCGATVTALGVIALMSVMGGAVLTKKRDL